MRVHIYVGSYGWEKPLGRWLRAAEAGFRVHGIRPRVLPADRPQPCDLAVAWSVRKQRALSSGRRALVMERGYLGDRFAWASMGYDGLNGRAEFCNADVPGDRWTRHFAHLMRPWRRPDDGGYVLILGQVTRDWAVRGVDIVAWYEATAARLREAGHKPWFRRHPREKPGRPLPLIPLRHGSLDAALAGARWAVTYNSNSAVDAVLAGVPTVAVDAGAMAWPVTGRDPAAPPPMPDRTRWAERLSWCQWSLDEIAAGEAWAHLSAGMAHTHARAPA